jgi:hypothetical protein
MGMKTVWKLSGVLALSFVLGGCGSSRLLNGMGLGGSAAPQTPVIQTGNNLAMPPDLQLRPPGTAVSENYQPNAVPAAPVQTAALNDSLYSSGAAPVTRAPARNVYEEYGISTTKPDGTKKTPDELSAELKLAILKRKQQQNPGYGTIRNIGSIFKNG